MRIDWYNVLRTIAQAAIVVVGVVLPMLTESWWQSIGVPSGTVSPILGAVCLALAAWWRQKYQHAFEPK